MSETSALQRLEWDATNIQYAEPERAAAMFETLEAIKEMDLIPRAELVAWLRKASAKLAIDSGELREAGASFGAGIALERAVALGAAAAELEAGNPWETQ